MIVEEKGICPSKVRPWVSLISISNLFIYLFNSYGLGSDERAYHSTFTKDVFYYFYGQANFYLSILIFSTHRHFSSFWTLLRNSSTSLIWYNMSQHVYKHKFELPHRREAQILGSASSRSQLQNLMIKAVESG
jgi:hypothetical protein